MASEFCLHPAVTFNIVPSRGSILLDSSHQARRLPAAAFARSNLMSSLSQTDLAAYPNKPVWDGALILGDGLYSFDYAFLSSCASIRSITA